VRVIGIRLACSGYGFECDFVLEGRRRLSLIEQLRSRFEDKHRIDYSTDAVIQMIVNRGYLRDSFRSK
jgi:hypothetical protein